MAEGLAVDVLGIGKHDVDRITAFQHHAGNHRLIGGHSVENNAQAPAVLPKAVFLPSVGENQLSGNLGLGTDKDFVHPAFLHDMALVDDRHPAAYLLDYLHLMGDHDDGNAHCPIDLL